VARDRTIWWMSLDPFDDLDGTARRLGEIAAEAGRLLAAVSDRTGGRRLKDDGSPTTAADLASEALILERLRAAWPEIPTVAEESCGAAVESRLFFLVDPLDGTKDFLTGEGEYSVNIALVAGQRPVAAAIAAPSVGRVWTAGHRAEVWMLTPDGLAAASPARAREAPASGLVALVSRRHGDSATDACLSGLPIAEARIASSAYKFCLIASGEADIYVRCGPTMEWDTAAGDHIVRTAGGIVCGPAGPLTYGHGENGFLNGPFVALGEPALAARVRLPDRCPG
jgi:3'(2'), 5'-bisphosphate nucleotidase